MPTEILVAILSLSGIVIGFLLRPLGEFLGETLRRRQATSDRKHNFQHDTLIELQEVLEIVLTAGSAHVPRDISKAQGRVESLTFRVRDDRLRELLEQLAAAPRESPEWRNIYGNVTRRLGEVLREM
jgi:hypothetical protein